MSFDLFENEATNQTADEKLQQYIDKLSDDDFQRYNPFLIHKKQIYERFEKSPSFSLLLKMQQKLGRTIIELKNLVIKYNKEKPNFDYLIETAKDIHDQQSNFDEKLIRFLENLTEENVKKLEENGKKIGKLKDFTLDESIFARSVDARLLALFDELKNFHL